jgi:transcriptional regulator with XRE-family HTH domain
MAKRHANPRGVILKKNVLKEARQALGLSQEALAGVADVSGYLAWRAENERPIDPSNAAKLAAAVRIPLTNLLLKRTA